MSELDELQSILQKYNTWLFDILNDTDKEKKDHHITLAGYLRTLLCDADTPILISFAERMGLPLRIVGNHPTIDGPTGLVLCLNFNSHLPHWDSLQTADTMDIKDFINEPIGIVPGKKGGLSYTPYQIIKWVANKEGASHFDFEKPATLKSLKGISFTSSEEKKEEILVKNLIYSLARWALIIIPFILNPKKLLSNAKSFYPEGNKNNDLIRLSGLQLISHYNLLEQSYFKTYFEGEHGFFVKSIDEPIPDGIGIHLLAYIPKYQLHNNDGYLFQAILGKSGKARLSIRFIEGKNQISCSLECEKYKSETISRIKIEEYFSLSFEIKFTDKKIKLVTTVNGDCQQIEEVREKFPEKNRRIKSYTIGSNALEKRHTTFFMTELLLCKEHLNDELLASLSKYLWLSLFEKYRTARQ